MKRNEKIGRMSAMELQWSAIECNGMECNGSKGSKIGPVSAMEMRADVLF